MGASPRARGAGRMDARARRWERVLGEMYDGSRFSEVVGPLDSQV